MLTKKPRRFHLVLVTCAIGVVIAAYYFMPRSRSALLLQAIAQVNDDAPTVSSAARATIKEAGTNVVALLLCELTKTDTRVLKWANSAYQSFRKDPYDELLKSAESRRSEVVTAFGVLGELASPFLPEMFRLFTNWNRQIGTDAPLRIAECIAVTGQSAKPWLVKALVHPDAAIRKASISVLGLHFEGATDLCLDVIPASSDSNAEVRELALFFLVGACPTSEQVRSILRNAVHDPDSHVRRYAERELTKFEH